jgi:hypothetical protein
MHVLKDWYYIIHHNFLKNINCSTLIPGEFLSVSPYYTYVDCPSVFETNTKYKAFFCDQEPIYPNLFDEGVRVRYFFHRYQNTLFFNTEISQDKNNILKKYNMEDVYYFYHAIAAQEMYLDGFYLNQDFNLNFDKVFISYNNLLDNNRIYRTDFVARLYEAGIISDGLVSYNSLGSEHINLSHPLLSTQSKEIISKNLNNLDKKLTIDYDVVNGAMSCMSGLENNNRAFVHVVTETIFYEMKLHLTEKVFKPIVSKQPFLLLAASGNLAYLRRYGFRTFGDFWDESYDNIINPGKRMSAVVEILTQLANMPHAELVKMKLAMQEILEHNHHHFYHNLRKTVVTELTDNMATALYNVNIAYDSTSLQNLNRILCY